MKIIVLHDLVTLTDRPDLEDNLVQAEQVAAALGGLGHKVSLLPLEDKVDRTAAALKNVKPDLVFNLVEAPLGMGRMIHMAPLLLDRLGIPYTGAGTRAMLLTSNKLSAKKALAEAGLPTPAWFEAGRESAGQAAPLGDCLIKSVWEHGSLGLESDSLIKGGSAESLGQAVAAKAAELGGEWFAEAYIEGREFNLSLLAGPDGVQVLPPAEIVFADYGAERLKVVGYRAKWREDSFEYAHTPRSFEFPAAEELLLARLREISRACWSLFRLKGWARVDFRVDEKGRPWVLEVNANPCLALDAGFMAAAERAEISQAEVLRRIVRDALDGKKADASQAVATARAKVGHG